MFSDSPIWIRWFPLRKYSMLRKPWRIGFIGLCRPCRYHIIGCSNLFWECFKPLYVTHEHPFLYSNHPQTTYTNRVCVTSEGTVLLFREPPQENLCTVRVPAVEPELTWRGRGQCQLYFLFFRFFHTELVWERISEVSCGVSSPPLCTQTGASPRDLPVHWHFHIYPLVLTCLSSVQTVSSDALARTAHTLLLPQVGTVGASARLNVAL